MNHRNLIVMLIFSIIIAGCGTKSDKPSKNGAVPKVEPVSKYGNPKSYKVMGETYHVRDTSKGYKEVGIASWYGKDFHGKRTSSGTPYNMHSYSAAHKTLPIPTYVKVTNLENGKSVNVRVDDRGPFSKGRIIDLSYQVAKDLGVIAKGTAKVKVEALAPYQHINSEKAAYGHTYTPEKLETTFSDSRGDIIEVENSSNTYTPPSNNTGPYTVQLNAYSNAYNASNYQSQIQQAYNLPAEVHYDGQFYRVIVNRYNSQSDAENGALALRNQGLTAKTFNIHP